MAAEELTPKLLELSKDLVVSSESNREPTD
jgi:hypothetical protein